MKNMKNKAMEKRNNGIPTSPPIIFVHHVFVQTKCFIGEDK